MANFAYANRNNDNTSLMKKDGQWGYYSTKQIQGKTIWEYDYNYNSEKFEMTLKPNILYKSSFISFSNSPTYKDASYDVDKRTLFGNIFNSHYIGGNNPKNNLSGYDYTTPPQNVLDGHAMRHDKDYDLEYVSGISGLLFSTKVIGADWRLVGGAYSVAFLEVGQPAGLRVQALAVGTFIGLAATPKTIAAGFIKLTEYSPAKNQGMRDFQY